MRKLNSVHVDQFHGETFLRIENHDEKNRMVVILTNRQKLSLARKLLKAITLPTSGPVRIRRPQNPVNRELIPARPGIRR
jgi:hypothetical protein